MTILPMRFWAVLVVLILGISVPNLGTAEPMYSTEADGAVITLYSEPCQLTAVVTNLPRRATWEERGVVFDGCWGVRPDLGLVVLYFSGDKTVGLAPMQAFQRVTNS